MSASSIVVKTKLWPTLFVFFLFGTASLIFMPQVFVDLAAYRDGSSSLGSFHFQEQFLFWVMFLVSLISLCFVLDRRGKLILDQDGYQNKTVFSSYRQKICWRHVEAIEVFSYERHSGVGINFSIDLKQSKDVDLKKIEKSKNKFGYDNVFWHRGFVLSHEFETIQGSFQDYFKKI